MTVYTQVTSNRFKTWAYLLIYTALVIVVGGVVAWYYDSSSILLIAGVIAIVQGIAGYWFSDSIALSLARAQPMDEKQYRPVYQLVDTLCITAGLPRPQLYIIPDSAINAFATGRDPRHAALAITAGALERLDKNELQGVLAHELSHIGNEDIRLMSLVAILGGTIALISHFFLRSLWWGGGRRRNNDNQGSGILAIIGIIFLLLAPLAASLIQLAISRKREFLADANGVLLTRYPEGLISALRKISGDTQQLEVATTATAHMYFSNPLREGGWLANLFATHPPIEERIKALQTGTGLSSNG